MRAVKEPHLVEGFDQNGEQDVEAHNRRSMRAVKQA